MQVQSTLSAAAQHFKTGTIQIDGLDYYYREAKPNGAGTIVVVHGITGTSYSMLQMAADWLDSGRRILVPDLPGHGLSGEPPIERLEDLADWLDHFMKAMRVTGPVTFVGNSFGCAILWVYLTKYGLGKRDHAVLGAPTPVVSKWSTSLFRLYKTVPAPAANYLYFNAFADQIRQIVLLGNGSDRLRRAFIDESLRVETPLIHHQYAGRLIEMLQREQPYYNYQLPTGLDRQLTVVYGAKDNIADRHVARRMTELLPAGTVIRVPDCGHIVQLEAIPELTKAVLMVR